MKVIFLAIAANSELYSKHRVAQANSWERVNTGKLIWMLGETEITEPEILETSILKLPIEEKFENILSKTILGVDWALKNIDFDYLVRINTSTFVNEKKLIKWLKREKSNNYIAGEIGMHPTQPDGKSSRVKFVAGNFIVMPKTICEQLAGINVIEYANYPDDVAISHYLRGMDVNIKRISRNDLTDNYPYLFSIQHRIKSWEDGELVVSRFNDITNLLECKIVRFPLELIKFNSVEFRRMPTLQSRNRIISLLTKVRFLLRCATYAPWNIFQKIKYNLAARS